MAFLSESVDRYLRFYSGNGFYIVAGQVGQPEIPIMEPRSDYDIQTDGGRMSAYSGTYTTDQTTPFRGIEVTFQCVLLPEFRDLVHAIGNPYRLSPWVVGGDTWTGVATNAIGTRLDARGNAIACVFPPDTVQQNYMINLAWTVQVPPAAAAGTAEYGEAKGLVVTNATQASDGQLVSVTITGMIMGSINPRLTAWPSGTESTPS